MKKITPILQFILICSGVFITSSALVAQVSSGGAYTALNPTLINPARIAQESKLIVNFARLPQQAIYNDSVWLERRDVLSSGWNGDFALSLGNGHTVSLAFSQTNITEPSPSWGMIDTYEKNTFWKGGVGYRYRNKSNLAFGVSIHGGYQEFITEDRNFAFFISPYSQGVTASFGIHKIAKEHSKQHGWGRFEYGFSLSNVGGDQNVRKSNRFVVPVYRPIPALNGGFSYQRHFDMSKDDHSIDIILNYELNRFMNGIEGDLLGRILNSLSDDENELKHMQHQLGLQLWHRRDKFLLGWYNSIFIDPVGEYGFPGPFGRRVIDPESRVHFFSALTAGYDPLLMSVSYNSFGGPEGQSFWALELGMRFPEKKKE